MPKIRIRDAALSAETFFRRVRWRYAYTYYIGLYGMKQRNYNTKKDKKTHPDRMETKKYCRFCKKHTMHKETK